MLDDTLATTLNSTWWVDSFTEGTERYIIILYTCLVMSLGIVGNGLVIYATYVYKSFDLDKITVIFIRFVELNQSSNFVQTADSSRCKVNTHF